MFTVRHQVHRHHHATDSFCFFGALPEDEDGAIDLEAGGCQRLSRFGSEEANDRLFALAERRGDAVEDASPRMRWHCSGGGRGSHGRVECGDDVGATGDGSVAYKVTGPGRANLPGGGAAAQRTRQQEGKGVAVRHGGSRWSLGKDRNGLRHRTAPPEYYPLMSCPVIPRTRSGEVPSLTVTEGEQMNVEDRLAQLERRVRHLEALAHRSTAPGESADTTGAEPPRSTLRPDHQEGRSGARPASPARALYDAARKPIQIPQFGELNAEQWFGQRGVLAAGVLLVTLAGAYFLKVAIDRGWISPATRCLAAILGGLAIASVGWRLVQRGTRAFGAALIGVGAGLVYLGIWAGASWYALVPPAWGIVGLALVAIATSAVAYRLGIELMGTVAALGALAGPVVIAAPDASANALLLYLGGVAATLGLAAVRRQWHSTTLLIVVISALLAMPAAEHAMAILTCGFAVAGGIAVLRLRHRWTGIALIGFLAAWRMLILATIPVGQEWLLIGSGLLLAALILQDALRTHQIWPDGSVLESSMRWSFSESLFFYLAPFMLHGTIATAIPTWSSQHHGAIALMLAVPYLAVGFLRVGWLRRPRSPFALVGTTAAAVAALTWPGSGFDGVVALLGMALLWSLLDHLQQRNDGRWYALMALGWAWLRFSAVVRDAGGAAFVDQYALMQWLGILVLVILARGLWKVAGRDVPESPLSLTISQEGFFALGDTLPSRIVPLLWVGAGFLLIAGVTNELVRLVAQSGLDGRIIPLATGLSVSAWWALCAGALVVFGFYRKLAAVRIAGLLVAGLAVIKVLFFDLANLDQLYRVGSFVILGVVLLCVAYLYHDKPQRARTADCGTSSLLRPLHHPQVRLQRLAALRELLLGVLVGDRRRR